MANELGFADQTRTTSAALERAAVALMLTRGQPQNYIDNARNRSWPIWHKAVADARLILEAAEREDA